MATPPAIAAPYISPVTLYTAPTGIDFTTIPAGDDDYYDTTANANALWDMCVRATARANAYCNQALRATTATEIHHGPDYRVTCGPAAGGFYRTPFWGIRGHGNTRVILTQWPILAVTQVRVCPSSIWPRIWKQLPAGWAEPENPPGMSWDSIAAGSGGGGSQAILIGPGYVGWDYGRNGYILEITYISGWPHAMLTAPAAAGATQLQVSECTGWAAGGYDGTSGAAGVLKDGAQQETVQVTASSAPDGPGTLTLAAPAAFPHAAGTLLTCLPGNVEQACIFFAAAEALTRGATSTTIHAVGGGAQSSGQSSAALVTQAMRLLAPLRRTI